MSVDSIYKCLQDSVSREIFKDRLLLSYTGEPCYVDKLVERVFPISQWQQKLNFLEATPFVIYGAGAATENLLFLLERCTVKHDIIAVCDGAKGKHGMNFYGYTIISPDELVTNYSHSSKILISTLDKKYDKVIFDILLSKGISENQIVILSEMNDLPEKLRRAYFSRSIIAPLLSDDEVFIDAGAYNFLTSMRFAEYASGKYKKIIALEPNPHQYPSCTESSKAIPRALVLPYALYSENTTLHFDIAAPATGRISAVSNKSIVVEARKLDDVLNGEKVTFIKMDIEGAELSALQGAINTIIADKPKLAICVYHKPEDIWEIPSYILSLRSDYKLYLRHYSTSMAETMLYAI